MLDDVKLQTFENRNEINLYSIKTNTKMNIPHIPKISLAMSKALLFALLLCTNNYISLSQKALGIVKESPGKILSFERQEDIGQIQSSLSNFRQSNAISMLGEHSLQWNWQTGASLKLPLYNFYSEGVKISPFDKDQCLVVWLYSQQASNGALTFTLTGEGLEPVSAKFYLDYKGWRTAHIPISQMQGNAPQKGDFNQYEYLEIHVPKNHPEKKGRFFLDDIYTTVLDARHPSADYQAPYIKAYYSGGPHATQWLGQKELPAKEDLEVKQIPISKTEMKGFDKLYADEIEELTKSFKGKGLSDKSYQDILKRFNSLKIKEVPYDGEIYLQGPYIALQGQGLPENIIEENIKSGHFIYLKSFQDVLHALAQDYHKSTNQQQKNELRKNFLLATRAYLQSGWAQGSNMGALHHLGYATRKIAPSFFMMKDVLLDAGLLDEVSGSLNWYVVAHVVNNGLHTSPDLDLFNTILYPHFLASMMHPKKEDAARHVKLLSQWLSRTFADSTGTGGFKPDGTAWHHWGHYPAYTNGAIDNAVIITNKLTLSGFPLSESGHLALQKAVKTILTYSQGDCIPRSLSGRHPLTGSHKNFINSAYIKIFVDIEPVDPELKQLHSYHTSNAELEGHWTLPYSAMSLHRRDNYLVSARGFGIYSWGSEIYNFNRFGRYQSYGTIDVLYKDDEKMPYEGYDWNLNPGTTITYLPLKELESPIPIFMVKSLSRFASGIRDKEGKNGAHGFILDESILFNIDPVYEEVETKEKLSARKSTFFIDDMVLCIGSGISGENGNAPVYTVLAQEEVQLVKENIIVGNAKVQKFPYEDVLRDSPMFYDGKHTGYVVLDNKSKLKISVKEQLSRGDECTFDELRKPPRETKKGIVNLRREPETKGEFMSAVIDHGIKPKHGSYIYTILPGVNEKQFLTKAKQIFDQPELFYHIISSRDELHAVRDVRNQSETYICYEAQSLIPHYNLLEVSDPCLLIFDYNESGSQSVSVALPDLNMTAYSREQKDKEWVSNEHELNLVFDGKWKIDSEKTTVFGVEYKNDKTIITVKAQHGVSNHFDMKMKYN